MIIDIFHRASQVVISPAAKTLDCVSKNNGLRIDLLFETKVSSDSARPISCKAMQGHQANLIMHSSVRQ